MNQTNLTIHSDDQMFTAFHGNKDLSFDERLLLCEYFRKGYELALIAKRLCEARNHSKPKILELPGGFGRVTRHLRKFLPLANITSVDIDRAATEFSKEQFKTETHCCQANDYEYNFLNDSSFDIAILGSLITHYSEETSRIILTNFLKKVTLRGQAVVTTHGARAAQLLAENNIYQISNSGRQHLLQQYRDRQFGFTEYIPGHSFEAGTTKMTGRAYGISLTHADWILKIAENLNFKLRDHHVGGWDDHQDVFVFDKLG